MRLSDGGAVAVAPIIGARARTLEGTVREMTDSTLLLGVRRVAREGGLEDTYEDVKLLLHSRDMDGVERSTTSISRSILAAGAVVATALLAAKGAGDVTGGRSGGPPPVGR